MNIFRKIFFAVCLPLALTVPEAAASQYEFTHITTGNSSLSYDGINCITQDSRGFIWIGTFKGLNRYDGSTFKVWNRDGLGLASDFVHTITEDGKGNIWVGTDNGVSVYDWEKDRFLPVTKPSRQGTVIRNKVTFITLDSKGTVWLLVNDQGCFSYDTDTGELNDIAYDEIGMAGFRKLLRKENGEFWLSRYHANLYRADKDFRNVRPALGPGKFRDYFVNDEIEGLFEGKDGAILVASTMNGISRIDPETGEVSNLFRIPGKAVLHHVFLEEGRYFWMATTEGVWRYDCQSGRSDCLKHDWKDAFSISNNYTNCVFVDKDSGIWIGTKEGGVNYCGRYQGNFEKQYLVDGEPMSGILVSGFAEDRNGRIWVATEEQGFLIYDPGTRKVTRFNNPAVPLRICALCPDGDDLWFGTRMGLFRLNTVTGRIRDFGVLKRKQGIHSPAVYTIHRTSSGEMFFATTLGVFRYDRQNDRIEELEQFDGVFTTGMADDTRDKGKLWLATFASGMLLWDSTDDSSPVRRFCMENDSGLKNNKISSVYVDREARVWAIGFSNGLSRFDRNEGKFLTFDSEDISALRSDVLFNALEDDSGCLWLASDKGLVEFDPVTTTAYVYTMQDGLLEDKLTKSGLKSSTGDMYFGSDNGFIRFNPERLQGGRLSARVIITSMNIGEEEAVFDKNVDLVPEVELPYGRNSFGFNFAILGNSTPSSNNVECRLEGYETEWRDILGSKSVFWYNVAPGQYRLQVRVSAKDGNWKEAHSPVTITVKPPFITSATGITILLLAIAAVIFLCIFGLQLRNSRRQKKMAEEFRKAKEEETFREKMNFFSHVVHEIKTPLTLIKTPLSNIMGRTSSGNGLDGETLHDLEVMNNSADYLTKLVNELLDYVRIEKMGFALKCEDIDLIERLKSLIFNFSDTARNENLSLSFETALGSATVSADSAALDKILNNLMINAVKYSDTSISVKAECTDDTIKVSFINDGEVIPPEYREEIFKPFVQYGKGGGTHKNGVGIGLPLARNLARMHSGDLVLSPEDGRTCFVLSLPLKAVVLKGDGVPEQEEGNRQEGPEESKPCILVADDNIEFREYLGSKLSGRWSVITAADGCSALKILKEQNIDLLVSDISMPDMSGLELCDAIRKDIELSHIPIIIVSARVSVESKIQAMEAGADLYVEKPF
ncbi:MAG: two-component regulator propeller domain-containing protein, partial [Candidatus Cryptobacteroides sp.]